MGRLINVILPAISFFHLLCHSLIWYNIQKYHLMSQFHVGFNPHMVVWKNCIFSRNAQSEMCHSPPSYVSSAQLMLQSQKNWSEKEALYKFAISLIKEFAHTTYRDKSLSDGHLCWIWRVVCRAHCASFETWSDALLMMELHVMPTRQKAPILIFDLFTAKYNEKRLQDLVTLQLISVIFLDQIKK